MAEFEGKLDEAQRNYRNDHNKQHFEAIFRLIDVDNSGSISCEELSAAFRPIHGEDLESASKAVVAYGDKNGDNRLSLQEFLDLLAEASDE